GTATYSSACIDAQRAWLGNADGEVLYTTDGGKFWNRVNLQPGTGHVTSIRFRNAQSGWLTTTSGAGNAWKSTDGGLTWANAGAPRFPAKAIDTFNDQTIIWVGSQAGGAPILRSTNGGGTWTYRRFTGSNNLNDVRFLDANTVWIAGDGWLIKSTNAGETYTTIIQNPQINFNNVSFSGLNHGWVTSSQGLMRTTNGGSTWNVVAAAPQGIRYVQAISPTTAWVTGDGFAARTTDGGATWGIEPLEADTTFVTGSWVNEYEGWAAGHRTSQSLENPYMSVFRRSVAPPAALSSISISPTLVVGGDRCTGTIILAKAAPEGGQTVQVSDNSSALHTPATVFIPAGQGVMDFPIRTEVVGAQALRTVTASFAGVTKTANVTITPGGLTSFRVEPAQVIGGESTTGTLTLSGPAPAGGRTITLTSSSSVIGVPPTVFIRESVSEIQFQISTSRYAGSPATRYVQARSGDVTRTASITVTATPTISTLTLSPSSVKGGQNSTGTVSLNAPAPAGGLVVELSDSSTAIDTPASVTVPAGARSATFVIQTQRVGSTATRQVFATLAGLTKSANLTLTP
ncbi:MAG TPA: hypothetical protein VEX38_01550, partial [Fimbriimonadaceae bacterium]|nr:hypothetical protein [Fimbriimonadaceae bacterium]